MKLFSDQTEYGQIIRSMGYSMARHDHDLAMDLIQPADIKIWQTGLIKVMEMKRAAVITMIRNVMLDQLRRDSNKHLVPADDLPPMEEYAA